MKRARVDVADESATVPLRHWWDDGSSKTGFVFPVVAGRDLTSEMRVPSKAPPGWSQQWDAIMVARRDHLRAPVDTMGCERLRDSRADAKTQRFHTLCALILSAQAKDEKTKESMDALLALPGGFTAASVSAMPPAQLEALIRPSGLYRQKAKALIRTSAVLVQRYDGDVPPTLAQMLELAGVGPKIGALAMSVCWDRDVSIGADTHVTRIAQRLGWVSGKGGKPADAEQVRIALEEWLPTSLWRPLNYGFVGFGQTLCEARKPKCEACPVASLCPSSSVSRSRE